MTQPLVSVVIPVLNVENRIAGLLDAVRDQTYPRGRYEIIVVDNGSADSTAQIVRREKDITLLVENRKQNPYAARNRGLEEAKGEVIALLDVNCHPVPAWLEEGVRALTERGADLAGGQVTFRYSPQETPAEWYDSLLFVDMEDLIRRGNSCAAGNLFFRREVLEAIGPFPDSERSGMDLYWTGKATGAGFALVYAPGAEVTYPARSFRPLFRKIYRVGTGQPRIWLDRGKHPLKVIAQILWQAVPPGTRVLKEKIRRRGKQEMSRRFWQLWLLHYLQQVTISLGWLRGLLRYYFRKRDDSGHSKRPGSSGRNE